MVRTPVGIPVLELIRKRRDPAISRSLRPTVAAVLAYVAALHVSADRPPLLAPLTAVLVVQVSLYATLVTGIKRIVIVIVGLLIAVFFTNLAGLTWWSLGVLVFVSLAVGHLLHLGYLVPEVAVSALLVLGVVHPATSALNHLTEALIGAGAGVLLNLAIPPPAYVQPAGEAVQDLATRMAGLLREVAREVTAGAGRDRTEAWLRSAHRLDREIIRVERELVRAEESMRFNPRARPVRHAARVLRSGLDSLERCSVSLRTLLRSLSDLGRERQPHEPLYSPDVAALLYRLLTHLADAVERFGLVTAAVAVAEAERAEADLVQSLLEAREARERISAQLRTQDPRNWELNGTVLANAAHIIEELDSSLQSALRLDEFSTTTRTP
ncbi:aromatic acid exporter family protein [Streptomyces sp. NPDC093261]|uniref:FUSC family protein n=1 Tax=Streptomyces sp. NPDC093261 TaxID=3366037 RepID=UPI00380E7954